MSDVAKIASGLSWWQRVAVCQIEGWTNWLSAKVADLPGVTLNSLVSLGCFERRRDPCDARRSEYRPLPLGQQVRAHLLENHDAR